MAMFQVNFFVMNVTLVTASFNLIHVITDEVISFVGGQVGMKLGQDTDDKANNMFMMAARVSPGIVGAAGAGKEAGKVGGRALMGKPKSASGSA